MNKTILIVIAIFITSVSYATQYSKLSIITSAKASGKWQALKAFIAANNLEDEWQAASYISDDHPAFIAATNAVVLSGIATSDEISAFLDASRDFAVPDMLFARYYARCMSNDMERVNWHGKVTSNSFNKATLKKTTFHEDGFVWTQPFRDESPRSRDERISEAERKARHEKAALAAAKRAEKKRLDRIALLTTNITAEAHALMAMKNWPEELATLYLRHELNTLMTNTVNAIIRPQ